MFRLKIFIFQKVKSLRRTARQYGDLISGIDKENAKINTAIKTLGLKLSHKSKKTKFG